MDNQALRSHLELADELTAASKRHADMSRQLADEALEIRKHVEASFQALDADEGELERDDRPVSIHVMDPMPILELERIATDVAEERERLLIRSVRRRSPFVDQDRPGITSQDLAVRRGFRMSTASLTGLLAKMTLRTRAFLSATTGVRPMRRPRLARKGYEE